MKVRLKLNSNPISLLKGYSINQGFCKIYLKFTEDSLHSGPELLASVPDVLVSLTQSLSLVPCLGPQPLTYYRVNVQIMFLSHL